MFISKSKIFIIFARGNISQNKKEQHSTALKKGIQGYGKAQQEVSRHNQYEILCSNVFGSCRNHKRNKQLKVTKLQ